MAQEAPISWAQLLDDAVRKPGRILAAYHAFHGYSVGNQMLALWQCIARGVEPGPIKTYNSWETLGRKVRKGEKALVLCQPRTVKVPDEKYPDDRTKDHLAIRGFMYPARWFTLSQTDGEAMELPVVPGWDLHTTLEVLQIKEVPFDMLDGNVLGFARPEQKELAVSPLAPMPMRVYFHELGHCLLHSGEGLGIGVDRIDMPRTLKEVEAESVALIVGEALGVDGAEYSRGYIQGWIDGDSIPEATAARIFKAADKILKAGSVGSAGTAERVVA